MVLTAFSVVKIDTNGKPIRDFLYRHSVVIMCYFLSFRRYNDTVVEKLRLFIPAIVRNNPF